MTDQGSPTSEIHVDMRVAAATAVAEQEAFDLFKKRFTLLNPEPVNPAKQIKDSLGWEFYGSLIVAAATLLLAGFATAGEFFHIASTTSQNIVFTWGRTLSAIFGVEGLIVIVAVLSVLKAEKNNISRNGYEKAKKLAIFVSVAAGVNGVLRGTMTTDPFWVSAIAFISFIVSASLAVGASFLAVTGGEIIGYQTRFARDYVGDSNAKHDEKHDAWWEELVDAFSRSYERKIARGELVIPTSEKQSVRSFGGKRTHAANAANAVEAKIVAYLQANYAQGMILGKGVLGATAVSDALGTAKSYTSVVIREYAASLNVAVEDEVETQ